MIKTNIKASLLLSFILLLIVSSCNDTDVVSDPLVTLNQIIENNSDLNLLLVISESANTDSIVIPANEKYILLEINTIGAIKGYKDCKTENLGGLSIEVKSSDSLIVNIDPKQASNWQFKLIEERSSGGGVGECSLVIDNENIE